MEKKEGVQDIADKVLKANKTQRQGRQFMLWILALVVGAALGWLGIKPLNELFTFIATVFTRLFQFIAVPTIALAVITTLAALVGNKNTGRIFAHAVTYTLLTTFCAAGIGLAMFLWIAPGNLPADVVGAGAASVPQNLEHLSYYDHILGLIPTLIGYKFTDSTGFPQKFKFSNIKGIPGTALHTDQSTAVYSSGRHSGICRSAFCTD